MIHKRTETNQQPISTIKEVKRDAKISQQQTQRQERAMAALALLLGPETDLALRLRATQRLLRQGPALLPLLLATLNRYPEIKTPSWLEFPPQYMHRSRLLVSLCRQAHIRLEALLQHPILAQTIGPVLWISVIEAANLLIHEDYETMLCEGVSAPWVTVRYAAIMTLAQRAASMPLRETTLYELCLCQDEEKDISVQFALSLALLRAKVESGLTGLMHLLDVSAPSEARLAVAELLFTEPLDYLTFTQREQITSLLLAAMQEEHEELAVQAAHALSAIALPSTLPSLDTLLRSPHTHIQVVALAALEELANQKIMRRILQRHELASQVVRLLQSPIREVRRQAGYTIAAFGGTFAQAALGTILLQPKHSSYLDALESRRLLHGVLRSPTRRKVIRWLLNALEQPEEDIQITALDSLIYLLCQTRTQKQKTARDALASELFHHDTIVHLLHAESAWVRQRAVELLGVLDAYPANLLLHLLSLLQKDTDSGVRACVAYTLGQIGTRQALPVLLHTLLDEDEYVVQAAIHTLGRLATPADSIVVSALI